MTKGLKPADRSSKPLTNPMRIVNLSVKRHHEVSATLSLFWQKRAKQTRKKCQKWETWTFTKKEGGSSNNNHHYEKKKNNKKNIYERKWRTRRKENIFERLQVFLVKRLKRKEAKKHHRKKRYLKNISWLHLDFRDRQGKRECCNEINNELRRDMRKQIS